MSSWVVRTESLETYKYLEYSTPTCIHSHSTWICLLQITYHHYSKLEDRISMPSLACHLHQRRDFPLVILYCGYDVSGCKFIAVGHSLISSIYRQKHVPSTLDTAGKQHHIPHIFAVEILLIDVTITAILPLSERGELLVLLHRC